jgi:Cd2+/Zn2+-exporting ATPase
VISCPCALVISIPLGYFGGIGAGSRNGILFKGSNFLDILANVQNVVMDKTGTMTEGVFKVQEVNFNDEFNTDEILKLVNALESKSHTLLQRLFINMWEKSIIRFCWKM